MKCLKFSTIIYHRSHYLSKKSDHVIKKLLEWTQWAFVNICYMFYPGFSPTLTQGLILKNTTRDSPLVKSAYQKIYFRISQLKHGVGTQKNLLNETKHM